MSKWSNSHCQWVLPTIGHYMTVWQIYTSRLAGVFIWTCQGQISRRFRPQQRKRQSGQHYRPVWPNLFKVKVEVEFVNLFVQILINQDKINEYLLKICTSMKKSLRKIPTSRKMLHKERLDTKHPSLQRAWRQMKLTKKNFGKCKYTKTNISIGAAKKGRWNLCQSSTCTCDRSSQWVEAISTLQSSTC